MTRLIAVISEDTAYQEVLCGVLTEVGYTPVLCGRGMASYAHACGARPAAIILCLAAQPTSEDWLLLDLLMSAPVLATTPLILRYPTTTPPAIERIAWQRHRCVVLARPFDLGALLWCLEELVGVPAGGAVRQGNASPDQLLHFPFPSALRPTAESGGTRGTRVAAVNLRQPGADAGAVSGPPVGREQAGRGTER